MSEITVDTSKMTLGDMLTLENWSSGTVKMAEIIELLDRCCVYPGGAKAIPVADIGKVAQAITDALGQKKA